MPTFVQFNPSTLKAIYNPTTKKVQVFHNDCTYCTPGTTPRKINVVLSGYQECPDCFVLGGSSLWFNTVDINGTYVLDQVAGYGGDYAENCKWAWSSQSDYGERWWDYTGVNCETQSYKEDLKPFYIEAIKKSATIIRVHFWFRDIVVLCTHDVDITVTSGCVDTGTYNDTTPCTLGNGYYGGTIRVYE